MPVTRRWTVEEVRALQQEDRAWPRYELVDGELLVTPSPGPPHQFVITELLVLLHAYLAREPAGRVTMSPADLELRTGTVTQPDIFVFPLGIPVAGSRLEWSDIKELLLAVEVLSPSSVRTDRIVKRDFCMANHVDEYWIVDTETRSVEVWRAGMSEQAEAVHSALVWTPRGARTSLTIDIPALFDRVAEAVRDTAWFFRPRA